MTEWSTEVSSEFLDGGFTQDVAEWSPPQPGGFPFRNEPCLDYSVPKCTHEVAFCKCGYIFKFHYSQFSDGKYLWEKFCPFCSRPNPHKTEIPKKMNREIFFFSGKKAKEKKMLEHTCTTCKNPAESYEHNYCGTCQTPYGWVDLEPFVFDFMDGRLRRI